MRELAVTYPGREGTMKTHGKAVVRLALIAALALPLSACAGKVRISSAKMCQAHGGTHDPSSQSCTYKSSTKPNRESCEAQNGWYDPAAQECMLMD